MGHGELNPTPPPSLRAKRYEYVTAETGTYLATYLNAGWDIVHGPYASRGNLLAVLRREKK